MQDEILGKALLSDSSPVPRYKIINELGDVIAENATIVLQNPVEQEGTPINTATLLSNETSEKFKNVVPATVNEALALLAEGQGVSFEGSIATLAWSSGLATVTIPVDTGSRITDALVFVIPDTDEGNIAVWQNCNVRCYDNQNTHLYFKASSNPGRYLNFTGMVFAL